MYKVKMVMSRSEASIPKVLREGMNNKTAVAISKIGMSQSKVFAKFPTRGDLDNTRVKV
jgi:hypothetical protein